jgi:hypothetical protein
MRSLPVCGLLILLAGCADDFARPGTWQPSRMNDANLRAMLVNPADATRGIAAVDERGQPGSRAVENLEQGRRPALPDLRLSRVGASTSGSAGGGNAR